MGVRYRGLAIEVLHISAQRPMDHMAELTLQNQGERNEHHRQGRLENDEDPGENAFVPNPIIPFHHLGQIVGTAYPRRKPSGQQSEQDGKEKNDTNRRCIPLPGKWHR